MRKRLPLLVMMSQPGAAVAVAAVALSMRRLPSEAAASGAASNANVMASAAANACLRGDWIGMQNPGRRINSGDCQPPTPTLGQ